MATETMYAWTPILAGGEVKEVRAPNGATRNVIQSRNRIAVGEKVTKAQLTEGSSDPDADWQAYIDGGAIRPYEFPKDLDPTSTESPLNFLRRRLREAAEAELSEEQQLLLATGMGAVVSDEQLAASQAGNLEEAMKAGTTAAPGDGTEKASK